MLSIYRVSSSSFVDVPNENTFVIFQLTTDDLFYAKVNDNGVISVVALGSGSAPTGYLTNNIIIPTTEYPVTLSSNEAQLHAIQLTFDSVVTLLDFPNLTELQFLGFNGCFIQDINLPLLTTMEGIVIKGCPFLTGVTIDNFVSMQGVLIELSPNLTQVSFANLTTVSGGFEIRNNETLTSIGFTSLLNCIDADFSGNALNVATVDAILAQLDANGEVNGVCLLDGGTNAMPTLGAANINVMSLSGKGWTVDYNPI
jgi:hypothetical protein